MLILDDTRGLTPAILRRLVAAVFTNALDLNDRAWVFDDTPETVPGTFKFWCAAAGHCSPEAIQQARTSMAWFWANRRRGVRIKGLATKRFKALQRGEEPLG